MNDYANNICVLKKKSNLLLIIFFYSHSVVRIHQLCVQFFSQLEQMKKKSVLCIKMPMPPLMPTRHVSHSFVYKKVNLLHTSPLCFSSIAIQTHICTKMRICEICVLLKNLFQCRLPKLMKKQGRMNDC